MKKHVAALVLLSMATHAFALSMSPGRGALLYDASYPSGPTSKPSNTPGQWVPNITSFNQGASSSSLQINRLYPYSGDIEMNCTGPSDCVFSGSDQNVYVYYDPPAYGKDSVAAYRAAFPAALIMAIIDGSTKSKLLAPLTYQEMGIKTAILAANTICPDENVDGIFFDLEPADFSVPGQFAFYKQISQSFSSGICVDAKHPNGRMFGVFLNPNKVADGDWNKVAAALGKNGFVAVSAYDVRDVCPPVPISIQGYTASITGMLQRMDAASKKYSISYTVLGPAASSFGEFEKLCQYDTSEPQSCKLIKDFSLEGITQVGYIKALRNIITANCKSVNYLGEDLWSWTQYKDPVNCDGSYILLPNIPDGDVVKYLQQYGASMSTETPPGI